MKDVDMLQWISYSVSLRGHVLHVIFCLCIVRSFFGVSQKREWGWVVGSIKPRWNGRSEDGS